MPPRRGLTRDFSEYPLYIPPSESINDDTNPSADISTATTGPAPPPKSPEPQDSDGSTTPRRRNSAVGGDNLGSAGALAGVLDLEQLHEVISIAYYMYLSARPRQSSHALSFYCSR